MAQDGTNLPAVRAAFQAIPEVVEKTARRELQEWADAEQARLAAAAGRASKLARKVAGGIHAGHATDGARLIAGGPGRATATGTYGDLFFGAEFGGGSRPATRQFQPYKRTGYWFFNQLEADDHSLDEAAEEALDAAADRWAD